jgi:hypothetical protein
VTRSLNRILIVAACAVVLSFFSAGATTLLNCASNVSYGYYQSHYGNGTTVGTDGDGCIIGDKIFNDFTYTTSGTNPVLKADVKVQTLGPLGSGALDLSPDIGLQFNASWTANSGQSSDSGIGFVVSVIGGGPQMIKDIGLVQVSTVIPDGTASVGEKGCGPAPCTVGPLSVITFDGGSSDPKTKTNNNFIFTPIGSIQVLKDINVTGGTSGFASISIVQDTFSQIPEPRALSLLLSLGLIGLALWKKRLHGITG